MSEGQDVPADGRRPNVILITTHDTGAALGCYGTPVATRQLDRLAAEGARFDAYYCTAAQCSPSRGSIMTGRFPHENGLMGLAHLGWEYGSGERTLAHELADAGYETLLFGVQHEDRGEGAPARLGYQVVGSEEREAVPLARDLAVWLAERAAAEDRDGVPFFAALGSSETHLPWRTGKPVPVDEVAVPPYLPDEPGIREELAKFYGSVLQVDEAVGIVMDALAETDLDRETLLIFTVDHGVAFPRAKGTGYDPGLETALIMRWPGAIPPGQQRPELLSNVDLLPTVLEAAGVERRGAKPLAGRSFWPLLTGGRYREREAIFFELTFHDRYNPLRGIRTQTHKCMLNFDPDAAACYIPADIYRSPSGQLLREELTRPGRPEVELYDVIGDPWEQENLAGDPDHAELRRELVSRVRAWMEESDDPLLQGHVIPPRVQAKRLQREEAEGSHTLPITPAERRVTAAALGDATGRGGAGGRR